MSFKWIHYHGQHRSQDECEAVTSNCECPTEGHQRTNKRRRATYYVRKDEIERLQDEIHLLEQELKRASDQSTRQPYRVQKQFVRAVEQNHILMAGTESMLTGYKQALGSQVTFPLSTFIHLPRDSKAREQLLCSQHGPKLEAVARVMKEHTRYLNLTLAQTRTEYLHLADGDSLSLHFGVVPLKDSCSLRQVYSALQYFFANWEHSASSAKPEQPMTDASTFKCGQHRVVQHGREGGKIQWNTVAFLELVEPTEPNDQAYAVGLMDFVDQDDRYRELSESSLSIEFTAAVLLTETATPTSSVVTLSRWHCTRYAAPTTKEQIEAIRQSTATCWEAMIDVIYNRSDKCTTRGEKH